MGAPTFGEMFRPYFREGKTILRKRHVKRRSSKVRAINEKLIAAIKDKGLSPSQACAVELAAAGKCSYQKVYDTATGGYIEKPVCKAEDMAKCLKEKMAEYVGKAEVKVKIPVRDLEAFYKSKHKPSV